MVVTYKRSCNCIDIYLSPSPFGRSSPQRSQGKKGVEDSRSQGFEGLFSNDLINALSILSTSPKSFPSIIVNFLLAIPARSVRDGL